MKLVKQASGKTTVKMSKAEWQSIGKKAGWLSKSAKWNFEKDDDDDDDVKNDKKDDKKDNKDNKDDKKNDKKDK